MKRKIKIIALILFGILFVTGCGCVWEDGAIHFKGKFDGASEQGIEYLENKYNTKCEYVKAAGGNDGFNGIYNFYVKCWNLDEDIYVITEETDEKFEYNFKDNYYRIKYEKEVVELLSMYIEKNIPYAKLFYSSDGSYSKGAIDDVQNVTSLKDYLSKDFIAYEIAVKESNYPGRENIADALINYYKQVKKIIPHSKVFFQVIPDDYFDIYSIKRNVYVPDFETIDDAFIKFDDNLNCDTIDWKSSDPKEYKCI